ncbi:MAG: hypothetical protein E6713_17625, partial [Sporomusaceae bacterium]|nr:hypothetical protein [Sporomusaceae bacterium]
MKQKILGITTFTLLLAMNQAAAAAQPDGVQFDGNLVVHARSQHDENPGNRSRTGIKTTLTLNATLPVAENVSAYTRFTYQRLNNNYGVFSADYFCNTKQENSALDAFGIKYQNAGYKYVLGLQALTLGGGLVYDNTYIGRHALPYAMSVSKQVGAVNLNFIGAKTNYQGNLSNDNFYVLQGTYAPDGQSSLGVMLARTSYGSDTRSRYAFADSTVNYVSVYGSRAVNDKVGISAELLKSSAKTENQAMQMSLKYTLDAKNTLTASYYYVEDQAVMTDYNATEMSAYPNSNAQGYSIAWIHKFDKNISLKIGDYDYKKIKAVNHSGASTD